MNAHIDPSISGPCARPFLLSELREGNKDKLGHLVEEILWIGHNYAIYRTEKGVYAQFSDNEREEMDQRQKFTQISKELCELRYLTQQMQSTWKLGFEPQESYRTSSLYDHNMAQAVMLVMEAKAAEGALLADKTLKMAVERATNDNTIRYLRCCLILWIVAIAAGVVLYRDVPSDWTIYMLGAMAGATGAVLSIAGRLQAFQLHPCRQSNMNYWMSGTRVGIGLLGGAALVLLAPTFLSSGLKDLVQAGGTETNIQWQGAVILGLIGGFTERLIPILLQQTSDKIAPAAGTPAQAANQTRANAADAILALTEHVPATRNQLAIALPPTPPPASGR